MSSPSPQLDTIQHIHFIGIGGIGMSALARYYQTAGKDVSGSDAVDSELLQDLAKEGIQVQVGQKAENVPATADLIVYTHAIGMKNPELLEAKNRQVPLLTYNQALGLVTREKFTIAVAGTHGKSTTTAMIALMMVRGGLDPTVIVGTKIREFGNSNFRFGKSNFLLIEACEYKRSFLDYYPHIVVLPNVDLDHLDYFKDQQDYNKAFAALLKKIPHTGYLIYNAQDTNTASILKNNKGFTIPVSFQADHFNVDHERFAYPPLRIPGAHNRSNAALSYMTGKVLNIRHEHIMAGLESFNGTWRRFENKGKLPTGALCFDDYGHHPTEIKATLAGMREMFAKERIICVFQPHQFSRTAHFLNEFGQAFAQADSVVIPDIYAVRDNQKDKEKVSVSTLVETIKKHHHDVLLGNGLENTALWLMENTGPNDVVITMGAGTIGTIYRYLVMQ